jgi:hypothetical protein
MIGMGGGVCFAWLLVLGHSIRGWVGWNRMGLSRAIRWIQCYDMIFVLLLYQLFDTLQSLMWCGCDVLYDVLRAL